MTPPVKVSLVPERNMRVPAGQRIRLDQVK